MSATLLATHPTGSGVLVAIVNGVPVYAAPGDAVVIVGDLT